MYLFGNQPSEPQPSISMLRSIATCASFLLFLTQCSASQHEVALNDLGEMHFYQHTREMHFSLNRLLYIENAQQLINNMENLLEAKNKTLSTANRQHFETNLKYNIAQLNRDITFIRSRKTVQKRLAFLPIIAGTVIYSAISYVSQEKKKMREKREAAFDKVEHIKKQLILIKNTAETSQNAIDDLMKILERNEQKIREMDSKIKEMNDFFDMLHITSSMLETHQNDMNKMENYFNGHIKDNFFRVIDIFQLEEQINMLNSSLSEQFILPPLSSFDLIEMSKIYTAVNYTHFTIVVKIPILNKQSFLFQEFIPIPLSHKNETIITDISSGYFIQNEENNIQIIPEDVLEECFSINNVLMCNSLIRNSFVRPDKCINGLLKYNSNRYCVNKTIERKNYFIKISATTLFIYAIQSLELKILCGLEEQIFNISDGNLINFAEYCELLEYSGNELNDTTILYSEINTPVFHPLLRVFNSTENKWTSNFEILNKTNLKYIEIINQTKPLFDYLDEQLKKRNETSSFWSFITEPFNDLMTSLDDMIGTIPRKMIHFTICYVVLPLVLFYASFQLIMLTIKKLICTRSS